jgi:hypothetical protein
LNCGDYRHRQVLATFEDSFQADRIVAAFETLASARSMPEQKRGRCPADYGADVMSFSTDAIAS